MGTLSNRLATWAERTFKTDIHYFLSGSFWSSLGQVAGSLSALLLSVVVARYIPPAAYGEYKYVIAVIATLSSFSLSNINVAVLQSTARGFDGALQEGFTQNLRWSAGIFLGAIAVAAYYLYQGNLALGVGMLIGGSLAPVSASAYLYASFLGGKNDFKRQAIYGAMFGSTIPSAALVVTALLLPSTLALLAVYFIVNTAVVLYFYHRTIRTYHPDPAARDAGMLTYAKHLSLMGILSGIAGNIDQLLTFHFVGGVGLAVYNFATGVVDQAKGPLKNIDTMVQVRFTNRTDTDIRSGMRNKMFWLFVTSLIGIGTYFLIAPFVYQLLFPAYLEAVPYSQVYALALVAIAFGPADSYLSAKKKVRERYIGTIANSVIQILCMAIGAVLWGLWGIVVARVVIRILSALVLQYLYQRAVAAEAASL